MKAAILLLVLALWPDDTVVSLTPARSLQPAERALIVNDMEKTLGIKLLTDSVSKFLFLIDRDEAEEILEALFWGSDHEVLERYRDKFDTIHVVYSPTNAKKSIRPGGRILCFYLTFSKGELTMITEIRQLDELGSVWRVPFFTKNQKRSCERMLLVLDEVGELMLKDPKDRAKILDHCIENIRKRPQKETGETSPDAASDKAEKQKEQLWHDILTDPIECEPSSCKWHS